MGKSTTKPGPKPKSGDRYKSGDLKPQSDRGPFPLTKCQSAVFPCRKISKFTTYLAGCDFLEKNV